MTDEPRFAVYDAAGAKVREVPVERSGVPGHYLFTEALSLGMGETLWCLVPGSNHLAQVEYGHVAIV